MCASHMMQTRITGFAVCPDCKCDTMVVFSDPEVSYFADGDTVLCDNCKKGGGYRYRPDGEVDVDWSK